RVAFRCARRKPGDRLCAFAPWRQIGTLLRVLTYALTDIYPRSYVFLVIETFAALAEPNRYRIVELLRSGARSVNDIGERLDLSQPLVSKHLRVLREAGLV